MILHCLFSSQLLILFSVLFRILTRIEATCRVLDAVTDAIVHPHNDPSCNVNWPQFLEQEHCFCNFIPTNFDENGCAQRFLILCTRVQTEIITQAKEDRIQTFPAESPEEEIETIFLINTTTTATTTGTISNNARSTATAVTGIQNGSVVVEKVPTTTASSIFDLQSNFTVTTLLTSVKQTEKTTSKRCDFRCLNGLCIDEDRVCDGNNDCQDVLTSDETVSTCANRPIICHRSTTVRCPKTNICVPREAFCDGIDDCGDGSDEVKEMCDLRPCPRQHGWFRCSLSRRCIPDVWLCDKHYDCEKSAFEDRSDETDAQCLGKTDNCWNKTHLFLCDSVDQCVLRVRTCDRRRDCADDSDEKSSRLFCSQGRVCNAGEFACLANRPFKKLDCIPEEWLCDGTADCADAADESDTTCGQRHRGVDKCNQFEFQCSLEVGGKCISRRWRCDGEDDCLDRSDELSCTDEELSCNASLNQFQCTSERRCIPVEWLCDGVDDCQDAEDELDCLKKIDSKGGFVSEPIQVIRGRRLSKL